LTLLSPPVLVYHILNGSQERKDLYRKMRNMGHHAPHAGEKSNKKIMKRITWSKVGLIGTHRVNKYACPLY